MALLTWAEFTEQTPTQLHPTRWSLIKKLFQSRRRRHRFVHQALEANARREAERIHNLEELVYEMRAEMNKQKKRRKR